MKIIDADTLEIIVMVERANTTRRLHRIRFGLHAPYQVSPPPLRAMAHSSGPVWVAGPSPYDSLIRNTSPI
jgi:hypothetical protein